MEFTINNADTMEKLANIQGDIKVSSNIVANTYSCDCTGCSNACFETCSDGMGDTD